MRTALLGLGLGLAMTVIGAQAQEYTSKDSSTTEYTTNEFHDKITTYTSYSFSEVDGRTKETAYITVSTVYGRRWDSLYNQIDLPDTTVSHYVDMGWKSPQLFAQL